LKLNQLKSTHGRAGFAVLWSLLIVTALSGFTVLAISLAQGSSIEATTRARRVRADYLTQAALEHAAESIYAALTSGAVVPTGNSMSIHGRDVSWTIEPIEGPTIAEDESGLKSYDTVFGIYAWGDIEGVRSEARQVVNARQVPIFQYAMFYENDMHFTWPAPMQINGPVHCNSGIYFSNWLDLTFNTNSLSAKSGVFLRTKFDEWNPSWLYKIQNTVKIRKWVEDPTQSSAPVEYDYLQPKRTLDEAGIANVSGYDSDFGGYDHNGDGQFGGNNDWKPFNVGAIERFSPPDFYAGEGDDFTLKTHEHGVTNVDIPPEDSMKMFVKETGGTHVWDEDLRQYIIAADGTGTHAKGPYHAKAGLSIIMKRNGTFNAYNALGIDITTELGGAVTKGRMYDARQADGNGKKIRINTVNVKKLVAAGKFPSNGILYVAGYNSGKGTRLKGFQISNGAELPQDLSIVSPDAVYVKGDFNTDQPKNAAVIADAVNLLSNDWNNSKVPGVLPEASDTSYNIAVYTGDTKATEDSMNGGPHNLVRFHENWRNKKCDISGSMVCGAHSRKAMGQFKVGGDYYKPPIRNWSFNEDFSQLENQPPGTPQYVSLDNVVSW
jgi:hypothetical protein